MLQTEAPALEIGAYPAFILSLNHSQCLHTFPILLVHEVQVDWLQHAPGMGVNIWPTPGYILTADNPNEKRPLFSPDK